MIWGLIFFSVIPITAPPVDAETTRFYRYATYRAHTILPASLRDLVRRHGKFLFEGLEQGLRVSPKAVNQARIMAETKKITTLINRQAHFRVVIAQMGYVSGLLATWSDPSIDRNGRIREGFHFYLNRKLKRFLFVFDGYSSHLRQVDYLKPVLIDLKKQRRQYGDILERNYGDVNFNPRYLFNEQSGVFGVCSIYFSNLARTSAHLWYHAWKDANGDLGKTPFVKNEQGILARR